MSEPRRVGDRVRTTSQLFGEVGSPRAATEVGEVFVDGSAELFVDAAHLDNGMRLSVVPLSAIRRLTAVETLAELAAPPLVERPGNVARKEGPP